MRPTLRLGRIAGIEVGVHWSLLVIGGLLVMSLGGDLLPDLAPDAGGSYWAAAVLATVLFFGSILAHELSHSVVAQRRGQRVEGITLWILGGVATMKDEARDARSEFLVASAGPAMSIVLGGTFIGIGVGLDAALASGSLLPAVAYYVGAVNLVLAVFNLLPGAPLDGGRILAAALWAWRNDRRRAQIAAARAGRVLGTLLVAVPVIQLLAGGGLNPWTAFVGLFVIDASRREELNARVSQTLDARTIAAMMTPIGPPVPEWTTVADLSAVLGSPLPSSVLLTDFGGAPSALLQTGALRSVPSADAPTVRVRDVAIPLAQVPAVPPDMPARQALDLGIPVLVVAEGHIVGVVGLDEVRGATGIDAAART